MREERMRALLLQAFPGSKIEIQNQSARHEGHAGNPGGGETHFRIEIASPAFSGMSLLEQHRQVKQVLLEEFQSGLHALELHTAVLESSLE